MDPTLVQSRGSGYLWGWGLGKSFGAETVEVQHVVKGEGSALIQVIRGDPFPRCPLKGIKDKPLSSFLSIFGRQTLEPEEIAASEVAFANL